MAKEEDAALIEKIKEMLIELTTELEMYQETTAILNDKMNMKMQTSSYDYIF